MTDTRKPHTESSENGSTRSRKLDTEELTPAQQAVVDMGKIARRSGAGPHTEDFRDK